MTDNYQDSGNIEATVKDIFKLKTIKDIQDLLLKIYPGFIINVLDKFSEDYPHFDQNWTGMCMSLKVNKAQIMLVDNFIEDDNHLLLKTFCEIFTQAGFVIRKYTEFFPCSVCDKVLPNEFAYNKLKELNIRVPEKWDTKCSTCSKC